MTIPDCLIRHWCKMRRLPENPDYLVTPIVWGVEIARIHSFNITAHSRGWNRYGKYLPPMDDATWKQMVDMEKRSFLERFGLQAHEVRIVHPAPGQFFFRVVQLSDDKWSFSAVNELLRETPCLAVRQPHEPHYMQKHFTEEIHL